MRMITMKDIAKELGISVVTVSKALAGKSGVSEPVRAKVKETAREMGYSLNSAARQLRQGSTQNICVIFSAAFGESPQTFYESMHSQLSIRLSKIDYTSTVEVVSSDMEAGGVLPNTILNRKADGLIVLGQISDRYLALLAAENIPMILLDFYTNNEAYTSITTNNFYSSYIITSYVISCGHKDIGFVGSINNSTSSIQDRYLGFYKALLEHNLPIHPHWLVEDRNDRGHMRPILLPKTLPTAFVCNCDEAAYTLMESLYAAGYSVPGDVSVVGFDDSIYSRITKPQVTTVAVDVDLMTGRAVECIVGIIKNNISGMGSLVIPGKLILRDSVKKLI